MYTLESSETPLRKALKLAVYGGPGSGKTHLALTFPNPVVIDTEGGTDFYRNRPGFGPFRVLKTKDFNQVLEVLTDVETGQLPCETVVIDSVTILYEVLREAAAQAAEQRALRNGKSPDDYTLTPRDWGKLKLRFQSLMTRLYNLPVHTVLTGWIRDVYEGEGDQLKRVGTTFDADKKLAFQPDILLELATVKGKYVAFVRKDRTGTWPVDTRLTDVSYATTFAPLVERIGVGQDPVPLMTEETAAQEGATQFDPVETGRAILRDLLCGQWGFDERQALWLLASKLRQPLRSWAEIPPERLSSLVDQLQATDPAKLRAFVAQHYQPVEPAPEEAAHGDGLSH
jgi:hypothetical protein